MFSFVSSSAIIKNVWLYNYNVNKNVSYYLLIGTFLSIFQLAYCIVQFLEKDPTLTEPVSIVWLRLLSHLLFDYVSFFIYFVSFAGH